MRRTALLPLLAGLLVLGGCRSRLPWAQPPPEGSWRLEGAEGVPRDELTRSAWRELNAIRGSPYPRAEAYDAAFQMERYLRQDGYPEADVKFEQEGRTMVFRVDPGPRACMGEVYFRGVTLAPTSTFREFFEPDTGLVPLLGGGQAIYAERVIADGVARMQGWYASRGYLDTTVGPPRKLLRAGGRRVDVLIPVVEGHRYHVRSVDVVGDAPCLLDGHEHVGAVFTRELPVTLAGEISTRLEQEGYLFAKVQPVTTVDRERHLVDIDLEVDRGTQRCLRTLTITGNERTSSGFLRRRVVLRPGQLLRKRQIDRSLQRIYELGLWKRMDVEFEKVGSTQADMRIQVEESVSQEIDFEIGWGSWELLRGRVRWRDFNFTGRGRYLEIAAIASIRHQGLDVLLQDPWILGDDNILSARIGGLNRVERFYSFYGFNTELYYERILDDGWKVRLGYLFDLREPYDVSTFLPPGEREDVEGLSRSAGLFARVRWDRRNHLFNPTTGWLLEARSFWSSPALGANLDYAEVDLRASNFLTLVDGTVLGAYVQFASKEILDGRANLPIQERYFLGGGETVRAFGQDQLTPLDPFGNGRGGRTLFMTSVELRQRIYEPFYAALFYDVGMIDEPSFSFDGAWGHGPGVGVRLYTPIGPLRLDAAYIVGDTWAATNRFQLHFAFGFSF